MPACTPRPLVLSAPNPRLPTLPLLLLICTDACAWTEGRCLIATADEKAPPISLPNGRKHEPAQCSSHYVFPGGWAGWRQVLVVLECECMHGVRMMLPGRTRTGRAEKCADGRDPRGELWMPIKRPGMHNVTRMACMLALCSSHCVFPGGWVAWRVYRHKAHIASLGSQHHAALHLTTA